MLIYLYTHTFWFAVGLKLISKSNLTYEKIFFIFNLFNLYFLFIFIIFIGLISFINIPTDYYNLPFAW